MVVLSFLTSPHTPSQLKQLRQQLATTQRLLDSYDTRGTAGDLQKLAAAAAHGRGCGRSHGRGDFVTCHVWPQPCPAQCRCGLREVPVRQPRRRRCLLLAGRVPVFT